MKTAKSASLIIPLIGLFASNANADGLEKVKLINGRKVIVQLTNAEPLSESCSGWRWGAEGDCPSMQISNLVVNVRGEEIFIPRSAYADLAAPKQIDLIYNKNTKGFDLVISGGDAALAFQAVLSFSFNKIVQRRVFSMEFRDKAWELTQYSFL